MVNIMKVKKGDLVVFTGYDQPPEPGQDILVEGETYEVAAVDAKERSVAVRVDNPDFNPKKKESDTNQKTMLLDIFEEEFEPAGDEPAEPVKSKAKPAKPTTKATPAKPTKAKAAAPAEDPEDPEDPEEEPEEEKPAAKGKAKAAPAKAAAKPAAKGKAAAKPAAKGKVKAKAEKPAEDADPYSDLSEDDEDSEILEMVNDAEDILDLAKEVAEEASAVEYKLGGVLFHVRKTGAYKELDKRYAEKGGFNLYVLEQLNVEYRKAMYLIDIYYKWNKFGLEAEKVAAIGWAKAAKIASVMTEETAEELLELAEQNTVADLVDNIKTNYVEKGGTKGEKKKMTIFKFKLYEDRAASVEEVLQAVAHSMGYKTLDDAFEQIVMEWAAEHPVSTSGSKAKAKAPAKAAPTKASGKSRA